MTLPNPRERIIVDDMLQYCETIKEIVRIGRDAFFDPSDVRNRTTVEHYLELLGEGAKSLGEAFLAYNPGIRWSALRRFRFDSAHPYDAKAKPVRYEEMWRFSVEDLPGISRRLRSARFPKQSGRE